jgi:hypothetical protein
LTSKSPKTALWLYSAVRKFEKTRFYFWLIAALLPDGSAAENPAAREFVRPPLPWLFILQTGGLISRKYSKIIMMVGGKWRGQNIVSRQTVSATYSARRPPI